MLQPKVAPKLIHTQKSILTMSPTLTQICVHLFVCVGLCVNKKSHRGAYYVIF